MRGQVPQLDTLLAEARVRRSFEVNRSEHAFRNGDYLVRTLPTRRNETAGGGVIDSHDPMSAESQSENVSEPSDTSPAVEFPSGVQRGEILLTIGAIFFVLTIALTHFVMGIFLAIIPGALAFAFLAAGTIRARSPASEADNRALGLLLLFAGFCSMAVVGFQACSLSYHEAFHNFSPLVSPLPSGING